MKRFYYYKTGLMQWPLPQTVLKTQLGELVAHGSHLLHEFFILGLKIGHSEQGTLVRGVNLDSGGGGRSSGQ